MTHAFTFGEISSLDIGVTVESIFVGTPQRRKTEETVPFRSSPIDMDAIMGYPTFDERTITVKFWERLEAKKIAGRQQELSSMFLSGYRKERFIDSEQPDSVYMAQCSSMDFGESTRKHLKCTAVFKASPYRYVNGEEVL